MDESVIRELEKSAKQAGMKLSAAIRVGAKLRPQCRGWTFSPKGESCAVGAAYEAITGTTEWPRNCDLYDYVAEVFGVERWFVRDVIAAINDNHSNKMTREQIADWLESLGY